MITATKKVLEFTRILMFHRDSSEFIMILMVTATKKVLEFTRILLFNRDSSEFIVKSRLRYIPYLPADRPHPRIGRTPNFQWFSWEKKNC